MISVAIPCFKPDLHYLEQAIQSVLSQSSESWELIVVDGEWEKNREIERLICNLNHHKIKYIHNNRDTTMAGNWNFALQSATSNYVTLLHQDDFLHKNYISALCEEVSQNNTYSLYFCNAKVVDTKSKSMFSFVDLIKILLRPNNGDCVLYGDKGLSSLLKGCFIFCPTVCYNKNKLGLIEFSKVYSMVTDLNFYFEVLKRGGKIKGIGNTLYFYRRHNDNQTAKLTANFTRFDEEVALYNRVYSELRDDWPISRSIARRKSIIKLHLAFLILKQLLKCNLKQFLALTSYLKNSI